MADETSPATTPAPDQAGPATTANTSGSQPAPTDAPQASPDATPPAKSKSPTAREKYLEDQVDALVAEILALITDRDGFQAQAQTSADALALATQELTTLKTAYADAMALDVAPSAVDKVTDIKDLMKRNGLKKAWLTPDDEPAFDERYLRHFYGDQAFEGLTVITLD
jgi:hypothetical protein